MDAIKGEQLPTWVGYGDELQMDHDLMGGDQPADEPPCGGFKEFLCRSSLAAQINCCINCPGACSQTLMYVMKLNVEVLVTCGLAEMRSLETA